MIKKFIKGQKNESRGIALLMIFITVAMVATLMYVQYAMEKYLEDINKKYGDLSVVYYTLDGSEIGDDDWTYSYDKLNHRRLQKVVSDGVDSQLIIIDEQDYEEVAPLKNENGEIIDIAKGVLISNRLMEELGSNKQITLVIQGEEKTVNVLGSYNEDDFYYLGSKAVPTLVASDSFIDSNYTNNLPFNTLFLKTKYKAEDVRTMVYDTDKYGIVNVLEEKDLEIRQSSQTFYYAISFILIGLITVVIGSIYNFCRLIVNRNLGEIGFFRSSGITFRHSVRILHEAILYLSLVSFFLGLFIGTIMGNLVINMEYGFNAVHIPSVLNILVSAIIVIILPLILLYFESSKYKNKSPVELLKSNREGAWDLEEDNLKPFAVKFITCAVLYLIFLLLDGYVKDILSIALKIARIYLVCKGLELGIILAFEFVSRLLSKKEFGQVVYLAMKNLSRDKKKKSSVFGLFILILSTYIAMFGVFFTFREDAVDKVENQFNGDLFITEFHGDSTVLSTKIENLQESDQVLYLEVARKQYMNIETSQIMAYFIRPEDFERSFNYKDYKTHKDIQLTEDGVIIGKSLAIAGKISVGDKITLKDGIDKIQFTVLDICDSNEYMGYVVYIPAFDQIKNPNTMTVIMRDNSNVIEFKQELEDFFSEDLSISPRISTKEEVKSNFRANAIKGTSFIEVMLIFIATIGALILLNQLLQYIDLQYREISVLRSMGMTVEEVKYKSYLEMAVMVIIGILFSLLAGYLMTREFVDIASYSAQMGDVWSYHYDLVGALKIVIYSLIVLTIGLYVKIKNLLSKNIVDGIKLE